MIPTDRPNGLDAFITGYLACLLWVGTDNTNPERGGEPLDSRFSIIDIPQAEIEKATEACTDFYNANRVDWVDHMDDQHAGHNFALTRNGHGTGFWDRGMGEAGKRLTEACRPYGEANLHEGDDGTLYYA